MNPGRVSLISIPRSRVLMTLNFVFFFISVDFAPVILQVLLDILLGDVRNDL